MNIYSVRKLFQKLMKYKIFEFDKKKKKKMSLSEIILQNHKESE